MEKFDVVQAWLDSVAYSHSKSEATSGWYKRKLMVFCNFINKTPQQIVDDYESMSDRDFRRKHAQYVRALISKLLREGYASGSIRNQVTAIKSFFKYNDLPLGHIPMAKPKVAFHNRDITKQEIVNLLQVSKPREKAFFCMMAQTGLRPITLCNLKLKHIEPDFGKGVIPCKVDVPEEIAKGEYHSYFTFMGKESIKHLEAYLVARPNIGLEDYLFAAYGTENRANPKSFSNLFARSIEALREKGIMNFEQKKEGRPRTVRLYNLRKFFRKYANQAGFEFVQFWMGHTVKAGVDDHYRPKDIEFHRELYAEKAMPHLRIEMPTPSETEQTIAELREQHRLELEKRDERIQEQEKRLHSLEKFQRETLERIQELAEFRREMKHFEKGGAVVTYYSKAGFLPKEVEEVADEALERQKEKFLKEAEKIDKVLRRRRKQ